MVAGDHHRHDAGGEALGDGSARLGTRRIDEPDQPEQVQLAVDVLDRQVAVRAARREREHAQPLGGHRIRAKVPRPGVDADAQRQHGLWRPLYRHEHIPAAIVHGGHPLAVGVERQLRDARQRLPQHFDVDAARVRVIDQRDLGGVAQPAAAGVARRIVVQREHLERVAAGLLAGRLEALQPQAVLRQRSGLVAADHGDRAERLDAGQSAYQRVLARHAMRTEGESDRHDRGQRLRNRRNGEADGRQEHQRHRFAARDAGGEDHGADRQHGEREAPPEACKPLLQGRARFARLLHQAGDRAELRRAARADDEAERAAAGRVRAGVRHVATVGERGVGRAGQQRFLVDRHRFAGQRRLVDAQRGGLDETEVGRHFRAGLQPHDVADDQVRCGHFAARRAADHVRVRSGQRSQRRHCLLGAPLLREAEDGIEHDDREDRAGLDAFADRKGDAGGDQQHADHEVGELRDENRRGSARLRLGQRVGSVALQALRRFPGGQPLSAGADGSQRLGGRQRVPRVCWKRGNGRAVHGRGREYRDRNPRPKSSM